MRFYEFQILKFQNLEFQVFKNIGTRHLQHIQFICLGFLKIVLSKIDLGFSWIVLNNFMYPKSRRKGLGVMDISTSSGNAQNQPKMILIINLITVFYIHNNFRISINKFKPLINSKCTELAEECPNSPKLLCHKIGIQTI